MKGKKVFYILAVVFTLLLSTSCSIALVKSNHRGPELDVITDKTVYEEGENVTIFFYNIGDEILSGGGPTVTIYNDEEEIVYQEGIYAWWQILPGEYEEWEPWDQTDQQGVQVPTGEYTAEGFLSGFEEDFVDTTIFSISNNQPPSAPVIDGPHKGRAGVTYEWTFYSVDPEGSDITYYIDFGDQCGASWFGPYPSGEVTVIAKTYLQQSTYIINAMAQDDEGTTSGWSYFDVEMPRSREIYNLFSRFIENHPLLTKIIGHLVNI